MGRSRAVFFAFCLDITKVCSRYVICSSERLTRPPSLIHQFTDPNAAPSGEKARQSLLKYHSLLFYANISHSALNAILPTPPSSSAATQPSRMHTLSVVIRQLLLTVLHPRFLLFFPTLVLHVPAYVTGSLAGRLLGKPAEEETYAQFKAVFGGLAATAAYAAVTRAIIRGLVGNSIGILAEVKTPNFTLPALRGLWAAGRWLFIGENDLSGKARAALGAFGIFYATSYALSHWHNYWVGCECTRGFWYGSLMLRLLPSQRTTGSSSAS